MKRIIYPIFLFIVTIELIFGAKVLLAPVHPIVAPPAKAQVLREGKIALLSDQSSYALNQTVSIMLNVDTGGHTTDGTDVYLQYDPAYLSVSQKGFTKGQIYQNYPPISIDEVKGIVRISGIASASGTFTGAGELEKLQFLPKKEGITTLKLLYQPNTTTYSNMIEAGTGKNLLEDSAFLTLTLRR